MLDIKNLNVKFTHVFFRNDGRIGTVKVSNKLRRSNLFTINSDEFRVVSIRDFIKEYAVDFYNDPKRDRRNEFCVFVDTHSNVGYLNRDGHAVRVYNAKDIALSFDVGITVANRIFRKAYNESNRDSSTCFGTTYRGRRFTVVNLMDEFFLEAHIGEDTLTSLLYKIIPERMLNKYGEECHEDDIHEPSWGLA